MDKDRIIEVLQEWNPWTRDLEGGIGREEYLDRLSRMAGSGQVVIVTGVRRSGKSTLLKQYIRERVAEGVDRRNFLFVNFEDPRFLGELSVDFFLRIFDAYREIVRPTATPEVFLDEVQNLPQWERAVRGLHDRQVARVFVSGSSSGLLSRELGTKLTGRHVDLTVYPLSFSEFLGFRSVPARSRLDLLANRDKIVPLLRDYLSQGGFPLAVLSQEPQEVLRGYLEDILLRDVAERHAVRKTERLRRLAGYYLTDVASKVSYRRIAASLGVSLDTVERYTDFLAESYLFFFVPKFSYSLREREVNPRKVYAIDAGLRNVSGLPFSADLGRLYENTVFLELLRCGKEIFYYAGKKECDFITKEGGRVREAIQVCHTVHRDNREQEIEGLVEAMAVFGLARGLVLTEDYEEELRIGERTVVFQPLWRWLLIREEKRKVT